MPDSLCACVRRRFQVDKRSGANWALKTTKIEIIGKDAAKLEEQALRDCRGHAHVVKLVGHRTVRSRASNFNHA